MATEETELKSAIKQYLDLMGIFSYPLLQGLGSYPGLPDRVMHYNSKVYYLEIKKPKGKLSDKQILFQEQCEADGIPYVVIRSIDEMIGYIEQWQNDKAEVVKYN